MSERAFRVILAIVIAIWVIFVLAPSMADFIPRAWASVQHLLPGDSPRVVIFVRDVYSRAGVDEVRVQIVTEQSTLVAISDENGEAVFEAVPAGRVRDIRAQKVDYEIGQINRPTVPHRQRAQFSLTLTSSSGRRLFIGHEAGAGAVALSLLDVASRLVLTPPGSSTPSDNLSALDMQVANDRLYILGTSRLLAINTGDGSVAASLAMRQQPVAFAVSAAGESIYLLVHSPQGNGYLLTSISTADWTQRVQIAVTMSATRATLLPSPDGRRVYLVPLGDQQISVYDTQAARRQAIYVVGEQIKDATLSADGRVLYILGERRDVPLVIETSAGSSVTTVLERAAGAAFPGSTRLFYAERYNGRWLCVLQPAAQQVTFIDLRLREVHTVIVGRDPSAMAYDPTGDVLFVANRGSNTLTLISLSNAEVIDTIDVRSKPAYLAMP